MMAYDSRSTPEPRPLGEDTAAALRDAVLQLWNEPAEGDAALQAAITRTIADAREQSLRAEDVIVAFKHLLTHLPELNAPERRMEAVRFRERLITLCIKAYYAP
jgi:hypothetical protein